MKKLEIGKRRSLGMEKMKQHVEGNNIEQTRAKLAELKFLNKQKKSLSDADYRQSAMALLIKIETMTGNKLTPEELELKNSIHQAGLGGQVQGEGDQVSEQTGAKLINYG